MIGRNTADPARWKRYRGGTAGHLWIDAAGTGQYRRMRELQGNITSPMWIGARIWFLSDFEGCGNLYSCLPDGTGVQRHTDHTEFYARHAQTDGRRIAYQCGAALWLFDPALGTTRQLDIRTPSHQTQLARKFVPAADHLGTASPHPAGHSVAVEARGKLFTFALWEGAVHEHGAGTSAGVEAARTRLGQWLADGNTLVAVNDGSGEERITCFDAQGTRAARELPWDLGRVVALRAAPVGTMVAISNHRNEVFVGDVASGVLTAVDRSDCGRTEDLAWSPDGAWLAYTWRASTRHTAIKLYGLGSGISTLVTTPEFNDYSPSFDPAGKYLCFLSLRTFDPVYDSVQFELSFHARHGPT